MKSKLILDKEQFDLTVSRLCYQLIENHDGFDSTVLIGLQPRGIFLANRINVTLNKLTGNKDLKTGSLDITFFRDDFRSRENMPVASETRIDFELENRKVVLIDDVLFTGRTIRAGLDAMLSFGRPRKVELLVLIDRRFARQLPIEPDYSGRKIDTRASDRVVVKWQQTDGQDGVWLITGSGDTEKNNE
ncbi:MAG: bifunctional pyr operon transcriptional regulator/uracil phosphoribosyltransferase PyrR [Bacteroidia bacterium]|nr:bifunctional pyr operon transcriptional regulator/uracil phosphoribosyltransferase PyrR [Bacteroidia bacterium]MCZ2277711.1 bifunctional pyr operon transcriptional regulator/uracil phosphoribosyltransferase PyrR [Bacteroidia bacterium]